MVKKIIKFLIYGTVDACKSLKFLVYCLREKYWYGYYEFPYREKNKGKRIHVLCTGPSMKRDLPEWMADPMFMEEDKVCVNFFYRDEVVKQLKPTIYCWADPGDFLPSRVGVFKELNELVDWKMKLVVPLCEKEKLARVKALLTNPLITLVPVSSLCYSGFERFRYLSWKSGRSVPSYVNISVMAVYISLNLGFSEIYLHGVEHTFFDNMGVDEENKLYLTDNHFYGSERRFVLACDGTPWHTKDWLYDKYLTFLEHERMRGYADYLGATIVNCTKKSLIDAYERLSEKTNKSIEKI